MAFVFLSKNLNNSDFGSQGGLVPNKISGVGTYFGALVHYFGDRISNAD
jgi:hypothetical protein